MHFRLTIHLRLANHKRIDPFVMNMSAKVAESLDGG